MLDPFTGLSTQHGRGGCHASRYSTVSLIVTLVAEWIHLTLLGVILPAIQLKVNTVGGLMNSATKVTVALTLAQHPVLYITLFGKGL